MEASSAGPAQSNPRIFYGWFVVAAAFAVTFVGFGSAYTFSAFVDCLAEGFRSLARLGFARLLARRLSVLRARGRERSACRPLGLPPPGRHRHDPHGGGLGDRERGAQPCRSLCRLRHWRRTWRRLRLCPRRWRGATLVPQTPWLCVRSRGERHRCRHARHAAARLASHRSAGLARSLPRPRLPCRRRGRWNGSPDRERSARSRHGSRRRSCTAARPSGSAARGLAAAKR